MGPSDIPLRARLQQSKVINLLPEKWDDTLQDELRELKSGEQAFMHTLPRLIQAGYTTLDSIPRIQKGSGTRFYCPALKELIVKPKSIKLDPAASQTPGSPSCNRHKRCPKTEGPRYKTTGRNDDVQTCRQIYCQTKQDTEPMHPLAMPGGRWGGVFP